MATYIVYPTNEKGIRVDGKNCIVLEAASAAAARTRAEVILGEVAGTITSADYAATALTGSATEDFVAGPKGPVGVAASAWPKLWRNGAPLAV